MPARSSTRRQTRYTTRPSSQPWVIREETLEFGKPHKPGKPIVLVLEEQKSNLYTLGHSLKADGYNVQCFSEEAPVIAKVRAGMHEHFLLLTARDSNFPVRALLVVQHLRRVGYEWPVVYCVKEKVSPEMQSSYERLSVDGVLSIPAKFCSPVLATFEWLGEQVDLGKSGMTILEC